MIYTYFFVTPSLRQDFRFVGCSSHHTALLIQHVLIGPGLNGWGIVYSSGSVWLRWLLQTVLYVRTNLSCCPERGVKYD